jgi:hypothetical protein
MTGRHHVSRPRRKLGGRCGDKGHAGVRRVGISPLSRLRKPRQLPRPLTDPPPQIGKLLEHLRNPPVVPVHRHTSHASSCRSIAISVDYTRVHSAVKPAPRGREKPPVQRPVSIAHR